MKKLFCTLAAVLVFVLCAVPCFADSGYTITNYAVNATLNADNTVTQTEDITVIFHEARHGILRSLPETVSVEKETAEGLKTFSYRMKIKDIYVEGAPFEAYTEDGFTILRIGDEDAYLTGEVHYKLHFTVDIGDDRLADYDEFFYSVNGPDWDTSIENFSFRVAFAQPLPAESVENFTVYSGNYGGTQNELITLTTQNENVIEGHSTAALPAQTGVTLYTRMSEGYFTGERTYSALTGIILLGILAVFSVFVLLKALTTKRKTPVQTVEFYPPDDISSAEVGYFIDCSADDKDLLSLIIWFADKGYLTIEGKKKKLTLQRVKSLPDTAPAYMHTMFNALFAAGETRKLNELDLSFYEKLTRAKAELATQFTGERKLHSGASYTAAILLPLVAVFLWVFGTVAAGDFINAETFIFSFLAGMPLVFLMVLRLVADTRWTFSTAGGKIGWLITAGVLSVVSALFALFACTTTLVPFWMPFTGWVLALLCSFFAPRFVRDTDYRVETAGKLLGLRNFIEKAELPRLKALVEQDPAYYYNVLPFAYVFGLSDVWAKQFETLAVPPPVWYGGGMDVYDLILFNHLIHHSFDDSLTHLHTLSANSGGGGGASFGGGGGFSGGGFGGGGGSSW